MKAMIFAAGLGTRLKPLTDSMPKALVPLNGKTLLAYQIEKLCAAGIRDIIINVHHFADQIVDYLTANHNFGCNITISNESGMLLETGGGLRKVAAFFDDEPFLVCNVDVLSNINIQALVQAHQVEDIATVVVSQRETQRYLLFDNTMKMVGWTNIKTGEVKGNCQLSISNGQSRRLAFSGMQILSPRVFEQMEGLGERFSLIDLYLKMCTTESIRAYVPQDYKMMDVGKIEHLAEAERFALEL